MIKSLRFKVLGVFLAGIIASMFLLTVLSNVLLKPVFIQNSKNIMIDYYPAVSSAITVSMKETRAVLEEMNKSYGITSHIVDEDGKVICSYTKTYSNKLNRSNFKKWIDLYEKRDGGYDYFFRNKMDESDNIKKLLYVREINDGQYLIMRKAVKGIEQDTRIVSFFLLIMGFTVAVIGTAAFAVLTKKFTDNIEKMSRITRKMSELDFSEKINLSSDDEIGVLASSIDVLSDELKLSIEGLKEDVERQKRLVRDISHEFKTPVTTVKGYIENIEALTSDDKTLQKYCRIASEECDVIDSLVGEILEMSRLESHSYVCDMEAVFTSDIEKKIVDKLSAEFSDRQFTLDIEDAEIVCNSVLITRAVMNYVKNAVKYGDEDSDIEINGYIKNKTYVFAVANKGKEIPDKEKENIWDLFYKNDKSRQRNESHGIGLSMVRQIAVLHKGTVNLERDNGKNIFSFTVPM